MPSRRWCQSVILYLLVLVAGTRKARLNSSEELPMRIPIVNPSELTEKQKPLYEDMRQGTQSHFKGFVNMRLCENVFPLQKLHATGDDPRRHDGLSIFLLYRFWSQPGRNLGPR